MTTTQTGNAQNVINIGVLNKTVSTFGPKYNPAHPAFTCAGLTELETKSEEVLRLEKVAENMVKKSTASRNLILEFMIKLITRSLNALRISGAMQPIIEQGEAIVRELRGLRAGEKYTKEEIAAAKAIGKKLRNNATHYSTVDTKMNNVGYYVQFIESVLEYNPNEVDLTVAAMKEQLTILKTAYTDSTRTDALWEAACNERNIVLYAPVTGLFTIEAGVKKYVKSVFGPGSPEFKAVSAIKFTNKK